MNLARKSGHVYCKVRLNDNLLATRRIPRFNVPRMQNGFMQMSVRMYLCVVCDTTFARTHCVNPFERTRQAQCVCCFARFTFRGRCFVLTSPIARYNYTTYAYFVTSNQRANFRLTVEFSCEMSDSRRRDVDEQSMDSSENRVTLRRSSISSGIRIAALRYETKKRM